MNYRHVILEGKPTTGKTEVSNLFKIYFRGQVLILPELTTVLVRENKLSILRDRKTLSDLLVEAVPARAQEVARLLEQHPGAMVLEESHMGVHWAYSQILEDTYFLDLYERQIAASVVAPDLFLRLDIPIGLSVERQQARATKDVEVDGEIVGRTFAYVDQWHEERGDKVTVVDTNRAPDVVIRDLMELLGLEYRPYVDQPAG